MARIKDEFQATHAQKNRDRKIRKLKENLLLNCP